MRWIVRFLGVVVVLIVAAVGALFLIPTERLANMAAERFNAATGRSLVFTGAVRPTLWPVIGASTGAVRLGNPDWAESDVLFAADGLDIGLDLSALMGGEVVVRQIDLRSPVIHLERAADGRATWDFAAPTAAGAAPPPVASGPALSALTVDRARITNGTVVFRDRGAGLALRLEGLEMELALPSMTAEAQIEARARLNGQAVTLAGTVAGLGPLIDGSVVAMRIDSRIGGSRLRYDGRASFAAVAEGQVEAELGDLGAIFAAIGQPAPDLPAALTRDLAASGRVTLAPEGSIHLREGRISAGGNRLSGAVDLTFPDPRPRLVAQIEASALDLSGLIDMTPGPNATGWPTSRIDASALGLIDGQIALSAPSVNLGFLQLGRVDAGVTIDRSRAVVALRELRLYDGNVTGELVANNRSGLSVGGNLRASDIALRPALMAFANFNRLSGTAQATVRFLGVGQTVDAIMRSLSGEGTVALGQGEILGLDLAGMLRNLDLSYMGEGTRTIYDSITGSFAMTNGVATTSDLRLAAPLVTVTGTGQVDIGRQSLDMRVVPVALAGADGAGGIRVPLLIRGPWAGPSFRLDLEGMAAERLGAEREALEQRARTAAEEAAAERLGVTVQPDETLGGAARRALEDRAGDALRGLLGGGGTQ
jgi:AsmA protein